MEQTGAEILAEQTKPGTRAPDGSEVVSADDRRSGIESDPVAIIAGLRGEMDRVTLTNDSSCICIVSPDGQADEQVMNVVGEWIADSLRSHDVLYRFATDKFLVMLRQTDRHGAVAYLKALRERLLKESMIATGGAGGARVTASFGGTMLDAQVPLHEHMDRASEAHRWALKGRGDTICMWTPRF